MSYDSPTDWTREPSLTLQEVIKLAKSNSAMKTKTTMKTDDAMETKELYVIKFEDEPKT